MAAAVLRGCEFSSRCGYRVTPVGGRGLYLRRSAGSDVTTVQSWYTAFLENQILFFVSFIPFRAHFARTCSPNELEAEGAE